MSSYIQIKMEDYGKELSSGLIAEEVYRKVIGYNQKVVVDFSGIESITPSIVTGLFARFMEEKGSDWFLRNVIIQNASTQVRRTIRDELNNWFWFIMGTITNSD